MFPSTRKNVSAIAESLKESLDEFRSVMTSVHRGMTTTRKSIEYMDTVRWNVPEYFKKL